MRPVHINFALSLLLKDSLFRSKSGGIIYGKILCDHLNQAGSDSAARRDGTTWPLIKIKLSTSVMTKATA